MKIVNFVGMSAVTAIALTNITIDAYNTELIIEPITFETVVKKEKPIYDIELDEQWQDLVWELCQELNLEYELILGAIHLESNFIVDCVSSNSNGSVDRGMGQINSKYQDWYAELSGINPEEFDPFNPEHSLKSLIYGMKYYRNYWVENHNIYHKETLDIHMLNSYNMGINGYKRYKRKYGITRAYDRVVQKKANSLKEKGRIEH